MKLFETKKHKVDLFFQRSGYNIHNHYYCFTLIPTIIIEIDNNKLCGWKEFKIEWLCFQIIIMIIELD